MAETRRTARNFTLASWPLIIGAAVAMNACSSREEPKTIQAYDLVILNGRVIDPASGLDGVRAIGVNGSLILDVTEDSIQGRDTIDARGMVVSPGFIDLHQHAQSPEGYRVEVADGTTTSLELEEGTTDVDTWYNERENRSLINHGVSAGHEGARRRVMHDSVGEVPTGPAKVRAATDSEIVAIAAVVDSGLKRGAIAVGIAIEFVPAAAPWEIVQVFRIAAQHHATVHIHMRSVEEPYYFLEIEEVLGAAAATGASAHIVHIQSSGGEDTPKMLDLIRGALKRGLDITAEVYPYTASMAPIESAEHDKWQSYSDKKFNRLEWPATGERLTRESFARYRKIGGDLVDYNNTEETVVAAVKDSLTMIASDGILHGTIGHPRVAGTFARVLGHYVRETNALTIMDALRKMTIAPARRLEKRVPSMARKGRLQMGADADIVVFDPATVIDRATYREPTLPPTGIRDVLVNGVPVVRGGTIRNGVYPGKAVRAPFN